MATRKNYVTEKWSRADTLASMNSGVVRSKEARDAENKAWEEAFERSKKVGAGRGTVNPEAVVPRETNSRAQYEHEKAAGDPNATQMSYEDWKKL
jgi:hypothetical protein